MKTRLDETNQMRKLMGLSLLTEEENPTGGTQTSLSKEESKKEIEQLENLINDMETTIKELKSEKKYKYGNILTRFKNKRKMVGMLKKSDQLQNKIDSLVKDMEQYDEGEVVSDSDKKKLKRDIGTALSYIGAIVIQINLVKHREKILKRVRKIIDSIN
jgi:preprotein translocase subunit SecF